MLIETECPCTIDCELHGDCVACFHAHLDKQKAIFCHRPENLISGELAARVIARLRSAGIFFEEKDGQRKFFLDRRLMERRIRERRELLSELLELEEDGRICERRSSQDRRKG